MTVKTKNISKRLGSLSLVLLMSMLLTVVTWAQSLDKGIYTISNNVSHDNPVGQGMARSYTEAISDVEVNDTGTYVSLGFNNTQYMGDFSISVDGSKVSYETTDLGNNMKKLTFKVPGLGSSIKVGLYVTAMDTNVEYTVTLDESSLKLVKKTEVAPEVEKETPSAPATQTEKPANNTSNVAETKPAQTDSAKPVASAKVEETKAPAKAETPKVEEAAKKVDTEKSEDKVAETEVKAEEIAPEVKTEEIVSEAKTETQVEAQEKAQEEAKKTEEQVEADAEQAKETDKEPTEEVFNEVEETQTDETENGSMTMILVVCGIIIIGAIGAVIYFKKK